MTKKLPQKGGEWGCLDVALYPGRMLAGIEDSEDVHTLIGYFVDKLIPPFGYRSEVAWQPIQIFLSGVFLGEVTQGSTQPDQGFLNISGCTYGVLGNVVVDTIKSLLSLG